MPIDKASVLKQIDDVLARSRQVETLAQFNPTTLQHDGVSNREVTEVITLVKHAIERCRPPGTVTFGDEALTRHIAPDQVLQMKVYSGMLTALRADYDADRLQSFRELVNTDLFADFLEMAYHLLEEGYKDAAAVMAGEVLEEHLRKLCVRHSMPVTTTDKAGNIRPKMIDGMNTDLTKAGTCNKIEKQSVTAWAAIRNAAAHGEYGKYTLEQVRGLIDGIRDFIGRHPA